MRFVSSASYDSHPSDNPDIRRRDTPSASPCQQLGLVVPDQARPDATIGRPALTVSPVPQRSGGHPEHVGGLGRREQPTGPAGLDDLAGQRGPLRGSETSSVSFTTTAAAAALASTATIAKATAAAMTHTIVAPDSPTHTHVEPLRMMVADSPVAFSVSVPESSASV